MFVSVAKGDDNVHHDEAMQAVRDGSILPLNEIIAKVQEELDGRVMGVRLEDSGEGLHGWIYHIRIHGNDGRLMDVHIDAGTASVLYIGSFQR